MISQCRAEFRPSWAVIVLLSALAIVPAVRAKELPDPDAQGQSAVLWLDLLADDLRDWVVERKLSGEHIQPPGVWTISPDRVLHCDGRGFGFLRYQCELSDFVFCCEYRLASGANSGIGIRGVPYESTIATRPSRAAYELQIIDQVNATHADGNMSLYNHLAPTSNPSKPAGAWNQLVVACRGPRIRVWLNGKLVQDVDQREHESIRDKPLSGYLQLQNHHSVVAFRNLRLFVAESEGGNWPTVTPDGQPCDLAGR